MVVIIVHSEHSVLKPHAEIEGQRTPSRPSRRTNSSMVVGISEVGTEGCAHEAQLDLYEMAGMTDNGNEDVKRVL